MNTVLSQSDLFSGWTKKNHNNINKSGSLHYDFSTHEFMKQACSGIGESCYYRKHKAFVFGPLLFYFTVLLQSREQRYSSFKEIISRVER
jgi:hypothetical protein